MTSLWTSVALTRGPTDDTWFVTAGPQYPERQMETDSEVHDLMHLLPESLQTFHLGLRYSKVTNSSVQGLTQR